MSFSGDKPRSAGPSRGRCKPFPGRYFCPAALQHPVPLAGPGLAIRGQPARREEHPPDVLLLPPRPWSKDPRSGLSPALVSPHLLVGALSAWCRNDATSLSPGTPVPAPGQTW
ncbi:hypothetical protein BEI_1525 [Halomonas beimenensis]|uniref:Uncharacterized protein n=1 Tax=Halomonas beimenensis TaxID=475662 RepID=A0A291P6M6_9GAMM|nr:hypothetical protein BEI_1525 [Halomonas beimenensis]